jgi:methyl-accepting chemotaxis protein
VAVPIKKDGQIVGVLASAMTLDAITKIVTNWKLGQTGYVFIVDQNGKVVAHQNKKFVQEQKNLSSHPLVKAARNNVMGMVEFKGLDGKDSIGFARKTDLGWTLAVQQNKNEAFAALKKAQSTAFLLFAATIISILFIAYFASRAIVTPIRKLTDAANRISVGELSVEIEKTSQDEIGDLADAITRMQDSIRLSIERLRRKKR